MIGKTFLNTKTFFVFILFFWAGVLQAQNTYQFELDYSVRKASNDAIVNSKGESICLISEGTGTNFAPSNLTKAYLLVFSPTGDTSTYYYNLGDTAFRFNKITKAINNGYLIVGNAKLYNTNETYLLALEVDSNFQKVWIKYFDYSEYWMAFVTDVFTIDNEYVIGLSCCAFPCTDLKSGLLRIDQHGNFVRQYLHSLTETSQAVFLLNSDSTRLWLFNDHFINTNWPPLRLAFDMEFNHIDTDTIPIQFYNKMTRWHNDSTFLVITSLRRINSTTQNDRDLFIIAFDSLLNQKRQFSIGTQDTIDESAFLAPLDFRHPDSVFFLGTKNVTIGLVMPGNLSWIMTGQVDKDFTPRYIHFIGGDAYYGTRYIKATPDGGSFICAERYNHETLVFNPLFMKLNNEGILVWSSEKNIPVSNAIAYPNPVAEKLTVECYLDSYIIGLYDSGGKLMFEQQAESGKTILNVSNLTSGFYTLQIHDKNLKLNEIKKIVKI